MRFAIEATSCVKDGNNNTTTYALVKKLDHIPAFTHWTNKSMKSEELNEKWRGFTTVLRLEFSVDLPAGSCTSTLELMRGDIGKGEVLVVEFLDVAAFSLEDFGGGLTQLLLLHVDDISHKQLDRRNYEVRELERDSLSFVCRDFRLLAPNI